MFWSWKRWQLLRWNSIQGKHYCCTECTPRVKHRGEIDFIAEDKYGRDGCTIWVRVGKNNFWFHGRGWIEQEPTKLKCSGKHPGTIKECYDYDRLYNERQCTIATFFAYGAKSWVRTDREQHKIRCLLVFYTATAILDLLDVIWIR